MTGSPQNKTSLTLIKMITRITSLLVLAAALSASVLSATPKNESPIAYSVVTVFLGGDHIERGAPRERVRALMGYPKREFSHDVWLYYGFAADLQQANEQGCLTLIITFAKNEVVDLKFVNDRAAAITAENLKVNLPVRYIALAD
jgi:outer membrane protein assembly factor BamE (lipoprotein component of BamABCDE complex)